MKFTKQDLLTLLIGLFLFASCKNTNTIGFQPDNNPIAGDLAILPVNSVTVADEVASTLTLPRYPLGFINDDPIFGDTEASLAMSVTLPGMAGYTFGKSPIIDSAILVLPYSAQCYGDTATSVYSFDVHQLKEDLILQKSFMSDKEWPFETPVVGTFSASVKPKTPVKISDIVPGAADTLKTVVPQLRIRLKDSFIQTGILDLDSTSLSTSLKFTNKFKGLHVNVNKTNATGKGGILFFDFSADEANIEIYYKRESAANPAVKDTIAVKFPISIITGPVAATVKHDYTGTPVKTQLDVPNPATPYPVTYLQAMAGIRNKISFPYLKNFVDSVKATGTVATKIIINRAELVVNLNNGSDVAPFAAAERLSLYQLDIAGQRTNIPDNNAPSESNPITNPRYAGSDAAFGGFYDATNKRYVFTVTAYLQDLIDGKTEDYGTYLAPSSFTEFNVFSAVTSGARSIINTKTPLAGNKGIKLNIYYTRVN